MTRKILKKIGAFCLIFLLVLPVYAQEDFVVKNINVVGLQRIKLQTVLEYLPIRAGQTMTAEDTANIISALYQTGFFSDVSLARSGNTLIIQVVERSTIGLIKLSGNKLVKTKDLLDALKQAGIAEGEAYDQATLSGMRQALLNQYYTIGRYNATVDTKVVPQSRNRVEVDIHIYEGHTAKVREINIIGNQTFKTKTLVNTFDMAPKPWYEFWNKSDDYSQEKLQKDLDALKTFYLDRGYLRFNIDSSQVTITPNRKDVYITIRVTEGGVYRIKGYNLSGDLLGKQAEVSKLIRLQPNEVFSRKKVLATNNAIGRYYGDMGYANAVVSVDPAIDDANKQVFLTFEVHPGDRVYVRRIDYSGNTKTADYVLRRETRQMEGGVYSVTNMDETKRRLNNLGYLENIDVKMEPVEGKPDQVDLKYSVKESSSTTASAQVGYSDTYGLLYGANLSQKNYKGTGKAVALGFNNSQFSQTYSFSYFNPYYTDSGISRGFNLYFQQTNPGGSTNTAPYNLDAYGAVMNYRIPLSEYDALNLGYGYEYLNIKTGTPSTQTTSFLNEHGSHFNNVKLILGWTHNTFDRAIFPTRGFNQYVGAEVGVPVLPNSLDYYRLNYDATVYQPLFKGLIVVLNTDWGYGNGYNGFDELPFFKNFYAGGMGTVRGYEGNTLGPKDSNGNPTGGNILADGSFNVIFPNPISERIRTSVFVDAGNVYQDNLDLAELRCSAGLEVDWMSPIAPLKFSLSRALNPHSTGAPGVGGTFPVADRTQVFNFSVGTSF